MRSTLLISAGFAMAIAGQALAAPIAGGPSGMPRTDAPMQSTAPATQSTQPETAPAGSPTGSASDTSAAAPAALSVGEPVKDNTGATIGAISSLSTSASGQQMAVIKMGNDTFQVASDKLGATDGAATINMTQAQISSMLHPPAGGK